MPKQWFDCVKDCWAIAEITEDSKELALESLVEELIKFQVVLSEDEACALLSTSIMRGEAFLIWETSCFRNCI